MKRTTAKVKFAWSQNKFYLAVVVNKNGFHPESVRGPWEGDGLQFAFDTIRNATKETFSYQSDDFEYAVWQHSGKVTVRRDVASASNYDSLQKPLGIVTDVDVAIRNNGNETVYEMAFPPFSVSPFQLQADSVCRFNLIVNMNDGTKRIGWLQIAPGIGEAKRPGFFPDLVLTK